MRRYDADMQHSIAAGFAAWPARYVHPTKRARERRLGLHAGPVFVPASAHRTVLRHRDVGPLTALRAPWRSLVVAPARPVASGMPHHGTSMAWTGSRRDGAARRPAVAPAWRA